MSRSTRSWWRASAVVMSLAIVTTACGKSNDNNASGSNNGTPVSIAFVGPKTGDAASLGINILNGAKLAVQQANDAQSKYKFTLKEFDTQGDPAQAPGQLAKYKDDASILGIVGPAFSGETKAVLPDLKNAGLVMISSSATNADLPNIPEGGSDVFHRVLPDDAAQGAGIAKFIKAKYAGKNVYFIDDNQEYSKGLTDQVSAALGTPKTAQNSTQINKDDDLYSAAVNAAKAAKPDLIFYGGYYQAAGKLKKQLSDAGVDAVFMSGDGSLDPGFISGAGAGAEGAIISCPCNLATESASGPLGTMAKDYKKAFNQDPGTYSSEAFDAANILIKGIEAGNTTRAKLLAYVEALPPYTGVSKKIVFQPNGDLEATTVYFFKVTNGKFVSAGDTDHL
ncbi:MAG TPA: branched-chain amino acid ABC transporter substrate-binding protein [Acidimicrobiales bacterium]|nr:branched-chain amino acid ABC transporter substrate-binding protein [Acidimicrobiales bacterium]